MKKIITNKSIYVALFIIALCMTLDSCQKKLTPEERKENLETKISENDCKEITNNALKVVLNNLRDIKYENILHGVYEDIYNLNKQNNYYISVVVSGSAKGVLNGVESVYHFYLYGRIPENKAGKKVFDDDGYNLSLKKDGLFVYNNKKDVNALNKEKLEHLKFSEEIRKINSKDGDALEDALQKEWDVSNSSSAVGAIKCYVSNVTVDNVEGSTVYVSYSLLSQYASGDIKSVNLKNARLTKDVNGIYNVEDIGYN